MNNQNSELKASSKLEIRLPEDQMQAIITLQNYLSFSCSGLVEVMRVMEKIDGWFTVPAGGVLFTCGILAPDNSAFVEIGSFKGRSTAVLGFSVRIGGKNSHIYAVDPHTGSEEHQPTGVMSASMPKEGTTYFEFLKNMQSCGHENIVSALKMPSVEAAKQWNGDKIGLLFIDGDHSIEGCESDFLAWESYLMPGGIILLHDVGEDFPGPAYVVEKYFKNSPKYKSLFQVDSLHVAYKLPA